MERKTNRMPKIIRIEHFWIRSPLSFLIYLHGVRAMKYEERYTDAELTKVVEQSMIYMCACPAQVADSVRKLRELYRYQVRCIANPDNDQLVHSQIAKSTIESHTIMQDCLDKIIELEAWDRSTLEMPVGLRERQLKEMLSGESGE
jgi:hypothetical protein